MFSTTAIYILLGVLCIVVGLALFAVIMRRQEKKANHDGNTVSLYLLETESMWYIADTPIISSLTWFKGDFTAAKSYIEKRLILIVNKNPWLQGRISITNFFKGTCKLSYVDHSIAGATTPINININIDENFYIVPPETSPLSRDSPFEDLGHILREAPGLTIKNGRLQPLFKVTIIPCSKNPHERFALVLQMSHVAGDGATYYKLLDMICSIDGEDDSIVKLDPVRIIKTDELQKAAMGKEEALYSSSTRMGFRYVFGSFLDMLRRRRTYPRYAYVDPAKIKVAKDASIKEKGVTGNVPFVSTNDIITSWFMSRAGCADSLMAINWRNRLEGHTDLHAGNYGNVMLYQRDDHASPALIRKSLTNYKRAVTTKDELPGFWKTITTDYSLVTNWSSFAESNEIQGCQEEIHLPIFCQPYGASTFQLMTVFRAGAGKVGLGYYGNSPDGTNLLDDAPFLLGSEKKSKTG